MKTGTRKPEPCLWLDIPQHEYHVVEPPEFGLVDEELTAIPKRTVTHKYVATGHEMSELYPVFTHKRQFRYVGTEGGE